MTEVFFLKIELKGETKLILQGPRRVLIDTRRHDEGFLSQPGAQWRNEVFIPVPKYYLLMDPEVSPFIRLSTLSRETIFTSPGTVCLSAQAAEPNSSASLSS